MTDKASSSQPLGWIVTVHMPTADGSRQLQVYYCAISDQDQATEFVGTYVNATPGTEVRAHQELSQSLYDALGMSPGDLKVPPV